MNRVIVFLVLIFWSAGYGLNLDEAIRQALQNHPYIRQERAFLNSAKYEFYSTYGNFLPKVSFNYTYSKSYGVDPIDYFGRNYSFSVNWDIYSSGQNLTLYKIKKFMFKSKEKSFNEIVLDIIYQVKKAYYKACANKEIFRLRSIQLRAAIKNYQMAKKKLNLGLVTKADFLQAKVRLENVRYSLITAENDYKKSIAELNSLIGRPINLDTEVDEKSLMNIEGKNIPEFSKIKDVAFRRPIISQYLNDIKTSKYQVLQSKLTFTPSIFINYSSNRDFNSLYGSDAYRMLKIGLSWTIFSGLSRYYSYLSAKENERYYRYRLKELKRNLTLNLYNLYLDLLTAYKNLEVSKTMLQEAERNFKQALGEYKTGKGDIISLLTAETYLANARETYVKSLLNIALSKSILEREMGIDNLHLVGKLQ